MESQSYPEGKGRGWFRVVALRIPGPGTVLNGAPPSTFLGCKLGVQDSCSQICGGRGLTPRGLHQSLYPPHRMAASTSDTCGANLSAVLLFTPFDLWLLGLPTPMLTTSLLCTVDWAALRKQVRGRGSPAQEEGGVAPRDPGYLPPSQD